MKKIYSLLLLAFPFLTDAQIVMSTTGSYSQDFNSLANTGTNIAWTDDVTIPSWYCQKSSAGAVVYDAGTGSSNTGKVYSFGSTASTDRALGTVGSGAVGNLAYGTLLHNTSLNTIEDISVSFTMEQWRDAGNATPAAQDLRVFYQISNTPITDLTPGLNATWIEVPALLTLSPVNNTAATALDGNLPANQVVISNVSIPNLSLFAGQYLMIKWEDPNHTGSDQGLSIDDLTINWAVGCNTSNFITEISCGDYTVPSGDEVYSTSGVYYDTIPNTGACDSVLIIDLTVNTITTYYVDADLDGFGNASDPGTPYCTDPGIGYSVNNLDCNDMSAMINPNAIEILDDGIDQNCNGMQDDCLDSDNDGFCDNIDICPGFDDSVDSDGDGVPDGCDLCAGFDDSADADLDGVPDGCDACAGFDDAVDSDGDGVADGCDLCPGFNDAVDSDGDGSPDGCDLCTGDDSTGDSDGDGICDDLDQCPGSDDSIDSDGDGIADGCDICNGNDATGDADGDGYCFDNDCDDNLNSVYPGAPEVLDNGIDENCDGTDNYLGVNDFNLTLGIHPNPSNGTFVILNDTGKSLTYSILSLNGSEITTGELSIGNNEMDLTSLEKGTYFIQVSFEGQKRTQKIVIN
ncbi:MAG: T9SS type A sorting domain-containing protein [Bacteroidetes bacterium]|nr:MAG: T9SS type A sorting domain-containing protein [Bacteroidota bacterium]